MPKSASRKPADPSRSGDTRRPLGRIFALHERIRDKGYPNCQTLADELGVTAKTIQRDITFMRDELDLPLNYDAIRHGYHYTRPVNDFPLLQASVQDVVALFLARQAIAPLQGSPLEEALRESFRRLSQSLEGKVSFQWHDLEEAFSSRSAGFVPKDLQVFEKVARAVMELRELRFEYRKIDSKEWESRVVRPFHLAQVDGGWYLIAHDPARQAKRTFALQRMRAVRMLTIRFLRPADFTLSEHLGGSFGVWHDPQQDAKRHCIRLRFTGWAARLVNERRWHPSQNVATKNDQTEESIMTLELSGYEEITRWILSWGDQCEVLEPAELRQQVAETFQRAGEMYG